MTNDEKRDIKLCVLKVIRDISEVAFSDDLGEYDISFTVMPNINIITMHLTNDSVHQECFKHEWLDSPDTNWQERLPTTVYCIPEFESRVKKGLAEIFNYVKGVEND